MLFWLITVGEPLPTEAKKKRPWRTGILAEMLVDRGHSVVWWTSSVNHFVKEHHVRDNASVQVSKRLKVQFLHGPMYGRNVSLDRLRNHIHIARSFDELAPKHPKPDLILCSLPTLELSVSATRFARRCGVPVLLDIRDRWPDEIVGLLPSFLRPAGRGIFYPMIRQARRALQAADGITAISSAYLDWGLKLARRPEGPLDAVFTHGYPRPAVADPQELVVTAMLRDLGVDPEKRIFSFLGTFVGSIDLTTVIEAARLLHREGRQDIQFVLSGSGQDDSLYRSLAGDLPNVVFTGWIDQREISALLTTAWAGIAAYKRGALMSLTNKLFEYMSFGLPILLSLPGEAAHIVLRNDCGTFYEPGDPASLADQVRRLADNPELRSRQSRNALRLFEEHYSAPVVYRRMADFLEAATGKQDILPFADGPSTRATGRADSTVLGK